MVHLIILISLIRIIRTSEPSYVFICLRVRLNLQIEETVEHCFLFVMAVWNGFKDHYDIHLQRILLRNAK
jgi:hypothetical protein